MEYVFYFVLIQLVVAGLWMYYPSYARISRDNARDNEFEIRRIAQDEAMQYTRPLHGYLRPNPPGCPPVLYPDLEGTEIRRPRRGRSSPLDRILGRAMDMIELWLQSELKKSEKADAPPPVPGPAPNAKWVPPNERPIRFVAPNMPPSWEEAGGPSAEPQKTWQMAPKSAAKEETDPNTDDTRDLELLGCQILLRRFATEMEEEGNDVVADRFSDAASDLEKLIAENQTTPAAPVTQPRTKGGVLASADDTPLSFLEKIRDAQEEHLQRIKKDAVDYSEAKKVTIAPGAIQSVEIGRFGLLLDCKLSISLEDKKIDPSLLNIRSVTVGAQRKLYPDYQPDLCPTKDELRYCEYEKKSKDGFTTEDLFQMAPFTAPPSIPVSIEIENTAPHPIVVCILLTAKTVKAQS